MTHNITMRDENNEFYVGDVRVSSYYLQRNGSAWHNSFTNHDKLDGAFFAAQDAYDRVDTLHEFVFEKRETRMRINGKLVDTGFGFLVGNNSEGEYIVPTNPFLSKKFEVVNYRDVCVAFDGITIDVKGKCVGIESMGFLGDKASDGFFFTISLESNKRLEDKLETAANEYLIIYISPTGRMEVFVSITLVVCNNTLVMARKNATSSQWTNHKPGAMVRMKGAMKFVYSEANSTQTALHDLLFSAIDTPINKLEMVEFAKIVYPDPLPIDATVVGKTPLAARKEAQELRVKKVEAQRAFITDGNGRAKQLAGVTSPMVGTWMEVLQMATFLHTYEGTRLTDPKLQAKMQTTGLLIGNERLSQQRMISHMTDKLVLA